MIDCLEQNSNMALMNKSNFEEQKRLADKCLNRITMLQEEIGSEEQRLMCLLKNCGSEIIETYS